MCLLPSTVWTMMCTHSFLPPDINMTAGFLGLTPWGARHWAGSQHLHFQIVSNVPIFSQDLITSYLLLLGSPHTNPSCIYPCTYHFPTNKTSGTFRVKSKSPVQQWKPWPCSLSGFVNLSHVISNAALGVLLVLASCHPSRWTPFIFLTCIPQSTRSSLSVVLYTDSLRILSLPYFSPTFL